MILASSSTDSIDPLPTLEALIGLLNQFRDLKPEDATHDVNVLIEEHCGKQAEKFMFLGARLEAEPNEAYPKSFPTDLTLKFLLNDERDQLRVFHVTADFGAKLQGKFI